MDLLQSLGKVLGLLACLACVAVALPLPDTGYSEGREGLGLDNVYNMQVGLQDSACAGDQQL